MIALSDMSAESRLWVFILSRPINPERLPILEAGLSEYVSTWSAHRKSVQGSFEVREGQVILLAALRGFEEVSGCSIDNMFRTIDGLARLVEAELVDPADIVFRREDKLVVCDRSTFRRLIAEGVVDSETKVFDPTIQQVSDLQGGKLELPASQCWHKRLFFS